MAELLSGWPIVFLIAACAMLCFYFVPAEDDETNPKGGPLRIVHLTTVHKRYDVRIFHKECASLRDAGHQVFLVVADGLGDEQAQGITIKDIGTAKGRFARFRLAFAKGYRAIRDIEPSVIHFHDPELLGLAAALKFFGFRVIYDVHEDLPRQVLTKPWLPHLVRPIVGRAVAAVEWIGGRMVDQIVAATPTIAARFPASKTVTVRNYPISHELTPQAAYESRKPIFAYVGGVSIERGLNEMATAAYLLWLERDITLAIAGQLWSKDLGIMEHDRYLDYRGMVDRKAVSGLLSESRGGLCLLHPNRNYVDSLPVKLFEYMAAGLPVIASDFPIWREIVDGAKCGICVNPEDAGKIAAAMKWLLDNPLEAAAMGERGRTAVMSTYNWQSEAPALLSAYKH